MKTEPAAASYEIPFNRPWISGNEYRYMAMAVEDGHISGDGQFTRACSQMLEAWLDAKRVLLTTYCTHALEMSALLLNFQPGDEVIMPSFTFVSTVNAFVLRGARPVFVDIRPDTLNMDEKLIEAADHSADQGDRAGALCWGRLRDGCHHGDRRKTRHSGGRRQRPRTVRHATTANCSGLSGAWRHRAFTRPRISPAARVGRW